MEKQIAVVFEKALTAEVMSMAKEMDGQEAVTEMTSRIGVLRLVDGRKAQVHVMVTTEQDDFLDLAP